MESPAGKPIKEPILENLVNTFECNLDWNDMPGSNRVRDCGQCKCKVFNMSQMSRREANAFLVENGTSQCMILEQRQDGSIVTDECPVPLRNIRNILGKLRHAVAVILTLTFSGAAALAQQCPPNSRAIMGKFVMPQVKFTMPTLAQFKTGRYALTNELVSEGSSIFLKIDEPQKESGDNSRLPELAQKKYKIEAEPLIMMTHALAAADRGMPRTADALYRIALQIVDNNKQKAPFIRSQIGCSYLNFLKANKQEAKASSLEKNLLNEE